MERWLLQTGGLCKEVVNVVVKRWSLQRGVRCREAVVVERWSM